MAIPVARKIPRTNTASPVFFVAGEAYPLRSYLMKPFSARGLTFSERVFNYRLLRARRTVENAFGILVIRFHILRSAMQLQPDCVYDVVMACCALHNFMRSETCTPTDPDEDTSYNNSTEQHIYTIKHEARKMGASYNANAKLVRD